MPKFAVKVFVIQPHCYTVEAENEAEAIGKAGALWAEDDEGFVDKCDLRIHDSDAEEIASEGVTPKGV